MAAAVVSHLVSGLPEKRGPRDTRIQKALACYSDSDCSSGSDVKVNVPPFRWHRRRLGTQRRANRVQEGQNQNDQRLVQQCLANNPPSKAQPRVQTPEIAAMRHLWEISFSHRLQYSFRPFQSLLGEAFRECLSECLFAGLPYRSAGCRRPSESPDRWNVFHSRFPHAR